MMRLWMLTFWDRVECEPGDYQMLTVDLQRPFLFLVTSVTDLSFCRIMSNCFCQTQNCQICLYIVVDSSDHLMKWWMHCRSSKYVISRRAISCDGPKQDLNKNGYFSTIDEAVSPSTFPSHLGQRDCGTWPWSYPTWIRRGDIIKRIWTQRHAKVLLLTATLGESCTSSPPRSWQQSTTWIPHCPSLPHQCHQNFHRCDANRR